MTNVEIDAWLVNGKILPMFEKGEACKLALEFMIGDGTRPPPKSLRITVHTNSGKTVVVVIPNDLKNTAAVLIDGKEV